MTTKTSDIYSNRKKTGIALLCLAVMAGCWVLFAVNSFGCPNIYEQYQSICVRRYREAPLGMLVFWIGNMWTSLLGFSIIALRNLLSLEELLLMAFSSWWLYRRFPDLKLTALVFLTGCVLLRSETFVIYNWDSGAYIFDTIALCLLISTIGKPTSLRLWLLGTALALMALARVPSALFIPFAFLLVWKSVRGAGNNRSEASYALLKMAGGLLITLILLTTLMCGSPMQYLAAFTSDNIITGHSPLADSDLLINRFKVMAIDMPAIWEIGTGCLLIPVIANRIRKSCKIALFTCWIIFSVILMVFLRSEANSPTLLLGIGAPVAIGLTIAFPVYRLFADTGKTDFRFRLSLWGCALMLLSIGIGSDSYIARIVSGFALAPVIGVIWGVRETGFRKYLKTTLIFVMACYSSLTLVHYARLVRKVQETPVTGHAPYDGLRLTDDFLQEVAMAEEAVKKVRNQGIPYLYLGDRRMMELTVGPDEGPGFNVFHYYPTVYNDWVNMKDDILSRIDAVVYADGASRADMQSVVDDIKASGFTQTETCGGAVILYRPVRQNPDKKYTNITASRVIE